MDKPKKKDTFIMNDDYIRNHGYNQCWDDREKWLKSKQMSVEEIAKIVLETNNRDYCRACEPCGNPPCQRIKDLAATIFTEREKRLEKK